MQRKMAAESDSEDLSDYIPQGDEEEDVEVKIVRSNKKEKKKSQFVTNNAICQLSFMALYGIGYKAWRMLSKVAASGFIKPHGLIGRKSNNSTKTMPKSLFMTFWKELQS